MEMFLVLAVILGVAVLWMKKRKVTLAELVAKLSGKHPRSQVAVPESVVEPEPAQKDNVIQQTEISAVEKQETIENKISESAAVDLQTAEVASASSSVAVEEKIPEDSTLKRHYLNTRQAEREAITNPYPTDSALRRHYQSMSAIVVNQPVAVEESENPAQVGIRPIIPEDSTLRRHFLTQVQAEVESQLFPQPTDSTLRRHYDNLLKAKMEEYLLTGEEA